MDWLQMLVAEGAELNLMGTLIVFQFGFATDSRLLFTFNFVKSLAVDRHCWVFLSSLSANGRIAS
jgi:hypothetical protein